MARLLSGRVGVTSYAGLTTSRVQYAGDPGFIGLEETEPNLGLPTNNDHVLYGKTDGSRYWAAPSGAPSGSVDGITVLDEGVQPSGFAGSITKVNFVGNGVEVVQTKQDSGGIEIGVATAYINKSTNNIQDANGFTRITGVTTFKVGAGLSFIELPQGQFTSGIVSIFSMADAKMDFLDDTGKTSVQDVGTLRIGMGLTITEISAGIASIRPTGRGFEHILATGIVTATTFKGNLEGNSTGTHNGGVVGDVTGNLTGDHTGNVNSTGVSTITQMQGNFDAGISTVTELQAGTINATGIITTSAGYVAPVGSFGFLGSLNSSGISTVAFFQGTNINITGIATAHGGFYVGNAAQLKTSISGNDTIINESGAGELKVQTSKLSLQNEAGSSDMITATQGGAVVINHNGSEVVTTKVGGLTVTGDVTATTFTGNITGDVTGTTNQITVADESTDTTCFPIFSVSATGDIEPKTGSNLAFNSNTGQLTATSFSGSASGLTNVPSTSLVGTLPTLDGSNLTSVDANRIKLTETNTTNAVHYLTFVDTVSGNEDLRTDTGITWNPSTNILSATTFQGNCTGLTGTPSVTLGDVTVAGNVMPDADATRNLGDNTTRWNNIYTTDMHFNNINTGGNSVDRTEGDWTLQEGKDNIYMINNITGKKYKINLTEV